MGTEALPREKSGRGVALTTHLHPERRVKMSRTTPLPSLCYGVTLPSPLILRLTVVPIFPFYLRRNSPNRASGASFIGFQITHKHTLLWMRDNFVVHAATCTTHSKQKRPTSIPSAGFEPAIPAIKRPQTYALDSTAIQHQLCSDVTSMQMRKRHYLWAIHG